MSKSNLLLKAVAKRSAEGAVYVSIGARSEPWMDFPLITMGLAHRRCSINICGINSRGPRQKDKYEPPPPDGKVGQAEPRKEALADRKKVYVNRALL